jgi:lysyl-tRNA synthetase class 2
VRDFFYSEGFMEVETPIRIPAPALETHIDAPVSGKAWLRTSPELHIKRLLVDGCDRVFEMGACFREAECGRRHNPEFTMLEWYRLQADYLDILHDTEQLVRCVLSSSLTYQGQHIDLSPPWPRIKVRDAFMTWAGWDPTQNWDANRFDEDLVAKVEPFLPSHTPCVLMDYPAQAAALARIKPDDPIVAERWEVYIGGLELANAYTELCDPVAQRKRFEVAADERRALGKSAYPMDEAFLKALECGLPPCGGIALGIDRLVMLACDAPDIADVRSFCQSPGELF